MTARYVPHTTGLEPRRVTLMREIHAPGRVNAWFEGTFEGEPVKVEVYDAGDTIALRKVLASGDSAIYDSPAYRVDLLPRPSRIDADLADLNAVAREALR